MNIPEVKGIKGVTADRCGIVDGNHADKKYLDRKVYLIDGELGAWRRIARSGPIKKPEANVVLGLVGKEDAFVIGAFVRWAEFEYATGYDILELSEDRAVTTAPTRIPEQQPKGTTTTKDSSKPKSK